MSRLTSLLAAYRPWLLHALGPALIALIAWGWIVTHLDPGGSDPASGAGPGLTIDESFNVQNGVLLVEAWRNYGIALVFPESAREIFHPREGMYLKDHPPLGRFWLGVHHHLTWWWKPPQNPEGPCVAARARVGSASAFALTILLLGVTTSQWYGRPIGMLTAIMFATIPRVFGHAHIASLESFTNLTYTAAVVAVASGWRSESAPNIKSASLTGAIFGLALLSKMQAVFIPVPLGLWALLRWRERALVPLIVWGLTGLIVFVVGWPTHWFEPWESIPKYFRGAADRASLSVWFNGMHYTDKTVPRSYVLMTFLWTVPISIPLLATIAVIGRYRRLHSSSASAGAFFSQELFILLEGLFPLVMFSLPRVPVYDAERLWLPALPLLVLSAAAGMALLMNLVKSRSPRAEAAVFGIATLALLFPAWNAARVAPCYLSSVNLLGGGLRGAERSGQELDYWGNALTRSLLTEIVKTVPRGSTIAVAPVLHQFQIQDLLTQSPILRAHDVHLIAYDPQQISADYLLVFRRRADLDPALEQRLRDGPRLAEVVRDGIVLAGLLTRSPASQK